MDSSLILSNVLKSPILFFFIGFSAVLLRSDLEIPRPIPKLFSLYLLFAVGFKGGHELHGSGLTPDIAIVLIAAVIVMSVVSIYSFFILRLKLDVYASASYIAVPAAMRLTVPAANPNLYISMALALTFPFNIIIGIPIYFQLIQRFWS